MFSGFDGFNIRLHGWLAVDELGIDSRKRSQQPAAGGDLGKMYYKCNLQSGLHNNKHETILKGHALAEKAGPSHPCFY